MTFEERLEMGRWWLISMDGSTTTTCHYNELGDREWDNAHTYINGKSIRLRRVPDCPSHATWHSAPYNHYTIATVQIKHLEQLDPYIFTVMTAMGMSVKDSYHIAVGVEP